MIRKGRIKENGEVVKKPETKIRKGEDTILLDNAPVEYVELEYYLLNKPQGVISATEDRRRETVVDLIDEKQRKVLCNPRSPHPRVLVSRPSGLLRNHPPRRSPAFLPLCPP